MLFLSLPSFGAEFYLTGGIGVAKQKPDNGIWWQDGFEYKLQKTTPTYHAGVGLQITDWLAVEGLYHDLGKQAIDATFTPQDSNYDKATKGCMGECLPLAKGSGLGRWKGYSFSFLPSIPVTEKLNVYARLGMINIMSAWREDVDFGQSHIVYLFRDHQRRPLLGLGFRYRGAYAEVSSWHWQHECSAGSTGQTMLSVGYQLKF